MLVGVSHGSVGRRLSFALQMLILSNLSSQRPRLHPVILAICQCLDVYRWPVIFTHTSDGCQHELYQHPLPVPQTLEPQTGYGEEDTSLMISFWVGQFGQELRAVVYLVTSSVQMNSKGGRSVCSWGQVINVLFVWFLLFHLQQC